MLVLNEGWSSITIGVVTKNHPVEHGDLGGMIV